MRRALLVLVALVLLAGAPGLLSAPADAAARKSAQRFTFDADRYAPQDSFVHLWGQLSGPRRSIDMQRLDGAAWNTVASTSTDRRGRFSWTVRGGAPGTAVFRAVALRTRIHRHWLAARTSATATTTISRSTSDGWSSGGGSTTTPPPPGPPSMVDEPLPEAVLDQRYQATLRTKDGRPGEWTLDHGQLPNGLSLDPSTGVISGYTARPTGLFSFVVRFEDTERNVVTVQRSITLPGSATAGDCAARSGAALTRITAGGSSETDLSGDGHYIVFTSTSPQVLGTTGNTRNVYLCDRTKGATTRITNGNYGSHTPRISSDGRYVVFTSEATDLVEDGQRGHGGTFEWDRVTGTTTRINTDPGSSVAVSADGRYVAYSTSESTARGSSAWGEVRRWDRETRQSDAVSFDYLPGYDPTISADGDTVAYETRNAPSDTTMEILVWDATTGATAQVSPDGWAGGSPEVSPDGSSVVFVASDPSNPSVSSYHRQVFVWTDADDSLTQLTDEAMGCENPSLSADGNWLTYTTSTRSRLGSDVYYSNVALLDMTDGTTRYLTIGDDSSFSPVISADGRFVVFWTWAQNLVPERSDDWSSDIFVWDRNAS